MGSKFKGYTLQEIWVEMPGRFQGVLFMLIIALAVESYQTLIKILKLTPMGLFGANLILLVVIWWVFHTSYDWLNEED